MWQYRWLPTAKIAVALHDELGRIPRMEVEQVLLLTQVRYQTVLGLPYRRKEQQQTGQLTIFQPGSPLPGTAMPIGSARIALVDQTLALPHGALTQAGCQRIFTDTASGSRGDAVGAY